MSGRILTRIGKRLSPSTHLWSKAEVHHEVAGKFRLQARGPPRPLGNDLNVVLENMIWVLTKPIQKGPKSRVRKSFKPILIASSPRNIFLLSICVIMRFSRARSSVEMLGNVS